MQLLLELSVTLYNEELFESSLLLAEHIYKTTKDKYVLVLIVQNLYKLRCFKRCLNIIEENTWLMSLHSVRVIFHRSKAVSGDKSEYEDISKFPNNKERGRTDVDNGLKLSSGISLFCDSAHNINENSESGARKCMDRGVNMKTEHGGGVSNVNKTNLPFIEMKGDNQLKENENISNNDNDFYLNLNKSNGRARSFFSDEFIGSLRFSIGHISCESNLKISVESIETFCNALTKPDIIRKNLLLESFRLDNKNLEALYFLARDDLINKSEFEELLNECHANYSFAYDAIFNNTEGLFCYRIEFYSFFYILNAARVLYKVNKKQMLFNLGTESIKLYPSCEYSYMALGLYFLLLKNYSEARKCLMHAFTLNNQSGECLLYLGICYSGLRECENAITCYNRAEKLMLGSWKPSYYLAFEYHRMCNFERASFYYKQALSLEKNKKIKEKYIELLIYYEYYQEAVSYLAINPSEHVLLRVYCNLFLGKLDEAKKCLENYTKDWKYWCTLGYIEHLQNNLQEAAHMYTKSLLLHHQQVIEDLLSTTIHNISKNEDNQAYEHANEIFEVVCSKSFECDVI